MSELNIFVLNLKIYKNGQKQKIMFTSVKKEIFFKIIYSIIQTTSKQGEDDDEDEMEDFSIPSY